MHQGAIETLPASALWAILFCCSAASSFHIASRPIPVCCLKASTCISCRTVAATATRCDAQELYGDLYTEKNVALSGIHTHSGPGGYLQYILYIITSLGFVRESFDVLVTGIVEVRLAQMMLNMPLPLRGT